MKAAKCATASKAHGYDDWIVPPGEDDPAAESRIFWAPCLTAKALRLYGTAFDESDSSPASWYWSSSRKGHLRVSVKFQRFSDGSWRIKKVPVTNTAAAIGGGVVGVVAIAVCAPLIVPLAVVGGVIAGYMAIRKKNNKSNSNKPNNNKPKDNGPDSLSVRLVRSVPVKKAAP